MIGFDENGMRALRVASRYRADTLSPPIKMVNEENLAEGVSKRAAHSKASVEDNATPQPHSPSSHGLYATSGGSFLSYLDWFVRVGALLLVSVGATVVLGWLFNITVFKSLLPGLETMKVNTAYGLLAAGLALWSLHTSAPGSQSRRFAKVLSVIVAALGALTLAEYLFDLDLGIDQLIFPDTSQVTHNLPPGRMSPIAAFNFLMIGFALFSLKARQSRVAACAHWLVIFPIFFATLAIVGYAYGVSSLYKIGPYSSMALHTALSFLILALALLAADSAHGFARIATSDTAGGLVTRRLLLTLPLLLFALGWVCLAGQRAELYDTQFGLALMVLASITVCVTAVAWTANILHKVDTTRMFAESEIKNINAGLEQQVRERTQQLAQLSTDLSHANKSLEKVALEDGLTSLANRRCFDTYLAAQIAVARRHERTLALVLCDVDAFKLYNDHYGHQAGDECLKQVAAALRSCCGRPADMAARYGGDEFAIILPDTNLAGAAKIAEAARGAVARLRIPHEHSSVGSYVSISGGVAVLRRKIGMTAEELITAADQSLYQAKKQGRDRMVCMQVEPGETPLAPDA